MSTLLSPLICQYNWQISLSIQAGCPSHQLKLWRRVYRIRIGNIYRSLLTDSLRHRSVFADNPLTYEQAKFVKNIKMVRSDLMRAGELGTVLPRIERSRSAVYWACRQLSGIRRSLWFRRRFRQSLSAEYWRWSPTSRWPSSSGNCQHTRTL